MSQESKKIRYLAAAGLLLAAVLWGLGFVVVKNSLESISVTYLLAFRFTIAAIGLAAIFHKRLKNIHMLQLRQGTVLGILLFASYYIQTLGCNYTTAGKNAFLTTVYVVAVPFLHWMFSKKRPDAFCMGAAVLAITGIGFLSLDSGFTMNIGDILSLVCGFGYALHMIFIDRYTQKQDPILLTLLQVAVAAALSWATALVTGEAFPVRVLNEDVIISMVYLGIFATMLGFLLQNLGQKYTAPSTAALLLSMESVFGVVLSILFLGEYLTGRMIIGCGLIFIAVIMSETRFEFVFTWLYLIRKGGITMKATLDRDGCISCGLCVDTCPEVFRMAADGIAEVHQKDVPKESEDSASEAQDGCPVSVITVE